MLAGKYVVLEGDEGAGKTTQLRYLKDTLEANGYRAEVVREPGGDPLAEELRQILKYSSHDITAFTEVLLFNAARRNLLERVIIPKLEQGIWCLADRSHVSTLVYQGIARMGLAKSEVAKICELTISVCRPSLIVVLDVPLGVSQARLQTRREATDRIESAGDTFRQRVNAGYRQVAVEECYALIDAVGSEEEIHQRVWSLVEPLLERK